MKLAFDLLMTWIFGGYWYPVYAQELWQTIDDCDVIERYQGYIRNDRLKVKRRIEWIRDAEKICDTLNNEPIGTQRKWRM